MIFRHYARAAALALFAVLLVTGAAKAIDLLTDMGGFSGGQITGLRDTFQPRFISPVTITATDSITRAEHANRVNLMAEVGGNALVTLTMPEATGTGNIYRFHVGVVNTSNYVIAALTSDTLAGSVSMLQDSGDTYIAFEVSGAHDKLTLNGTTTGGVTIGDWIELIDCLDTTWCVTGVLTGSGSEASPAGSS